MSKFELKKIVFILTALLLSIVNAGMVTAETQPPEELQIPGRIEGNGTHFEINNSEYLNVTLDSSEPVRIDLESIPEMVTIMIEPISNASSTMVTLGGFLPLTTYHKYEDDYHNHTAFTTDISGNYTYIQDLYNPHLVFIQPRPSTKFISNNATGGDCISIGIWDSATSTCTLTTDVYETVQVDNDGIVLDGNGHTITGSRIGGIGVYLYSKTGVVIKNLKIVSAGAGINIYGTQPGNNIITNNTIIGSGDAIKLINTPRSIITNNVLENNYYGVYLRYSHDNTVSNNTAVKNEVGIVLETSYGNTVVNNTATDNVYGVIFYWPGRGAHFNKLFNNNLSNNWGYGILNYGSNYNTITNNTIDSNGKGIYLTFSSSFNTIANNSISNNGHGIDLVGVSSYNNVYNNNFISNSVQAYVEGEGNLFNLAAPIGGNYWSDYDTPVEGCNNLNGDSFCDSPYVFTGGQDNLPWTKNDDIAPITNISLSGTLGNTGWYVFDVQITLTAADNEGGSGIAKTEYSLDDISWNTYTAPFTITNEGTKTVYYKSTDNAGNVELIKNQTVKIDKTPPQVTINAPANEGIYILNQTLTADWSAYDSLSGIASATGTLPSGAAIDTGTVGTKTFTVTATDNASNTATQIVPYTIAYNFLGILPPIRTDGSSIFKMGSTVPVKFRIADANGNYVSTAVANLTYQKITDDILGTIEEAVSTSEATEGDTFRYDGADNIYIFNLGTNGVTAGTYQLNVNLDDGTVHTVRISLR